MNKSYIYTIISVLCWATLAPVTKMLLSGIPDLEALAVSSFIAFLFLLIANIINGGIKKMKSYKARDYGIMAGLGFLWLGIFVNALAYLFWAMALKESDNTARVANFAYLTPFLSLIVSAVLLKEKIELVAVIALVFIIGGILLQYFFDRKVKD